MGGGITRAGVLAAVGALAHGALVACGPSARRCSEGCTPDARCDEATQLCVLRPGGAGGSSGTAGGSGAAGGGGGAAGGTSVCSPACNAATQCRAGACVGRYGSLQVRAPARAGRGPVRIGAELSLAVGATAADPGSLSVWLDAGVLTDDGGRAVLELPRVDAGYFEAVARFPLVEGAYGVWVAYPDAGLTGGGLTRVDLTGPKVEVRLSAPPLRAEDGGFSAADPAVPGAYRRDESVTVFVDSQEPELVSAGVEVASDAGVVQTFAAVDAGCASRFDGGVCRQQRVELWRHPMNSFRASLSVSARARDELGNESTVDGGTIHVTRHKWGRHVTRLVESMVLTRDGNLILYVVGTATSQLMSFTPEGAERWRRSTTGVSGRLMVGEVGTEPRLYVEELFAGGVYELSVFGSNDPFTGAMTTAYATAVTSPLAGPLLIVRTDELAYLATKFGGIATLAARSRGTGMVASATTPPFGAGYHLGNPVTDNRTVLVPFQDNAFADAGVLEFDFPFATGSPPRFVGLGSTVGRAHSAAFIAENNSVVSVADGGTQSLVLTRTGAYPSPLTAPAISVGPTQLYLGDEAPRPLQPTLCTMPFNGPTVTLCADLGSYTTAMLGAPAVGRRSLYVGTIDNVTTQMGFRLKAVDATSLIVEWETPLLVSGYVVRPMELDCSRDATGARLSGRPGVLYAISPILGMPVQTLVWAIIVDSPGVDANAPWPMQTHDPRNTNNLATSLSEFSCP